MGARGAPADPFKSGLYCRHCRSKYCSCDGYGNTDSWDDNWEGFDAGYAYSEANEAEDHATGDQGTNDSAPPPEATESEGWTLANTVAVGAAVIGAGVVVAAVGPAIGISVAVGSFIGGDLLRRFREK